MKDQSSKPNNPFIYPQTVNKGTPHEWNETGLTLRDYFASKAISNHPLNAYHVTEIAEYAYGLADAMLKQREL